MSSSVVRTRARACVADASWPSGLPYFETVEQEPTPRPDPSTVSAWCTMDFEADTDDPIGISGDALKREEGRIVVRCLAVGASGDSVVLPLAEQAAAALEAFDWQGIYLRSVDPPTPADTEDDTWAELDVVVSYERDHAP